jgi:hypothetical protein
MTKKFTCYPPGVTGEQIVDEFIRLLEAKVEAEKTATPKAKNTEDKTE